MGISPVSRDFLNMVVRIESISGTNFLRIIGLILSGPDALLGFKF